MTPEEQGILNALVAARQNGGLIGFIAMVALGLLGWLGQRVYRGLGHAIKNAQQAAANAAGAAVEADRLRREGDNAIHAKLDHHIDRDGETHQELLKTMGEQGQLLGKIHAQLERALGERPTRTEVRDMVRDMHGVKT